MNTTVRLVHYETGRAHPQWYEPLTRWRWARVGFDLAPDEAKHDARLWLLLGAPVEPTPLEVRWNDGLLVSLDAMPSRTGWQWIGLDVPASHLAAGSNTLELRADNPAMTGWTLAFEPTCNPTTSAVSHDRGQSWCPDTMGSHHSLRGAFVARLRTGASHIYPAAVMPSIIYEDVNHPRVRELRTCIPRDILNEADARKQRRIQFRSATPGKALRTSRGVR